MTIVNKYKKDNESMNIHRTMVYKDNTCDTFIAILWSMVYKDNTVDNGFII